MKKQIVALLSLIVSFFLYAHGNEPHDEKKNKDTHSEMSNAQHMPDVSQMHIDQTNQAYRERVKVIFEKKCFDCHGTIAEFPWYYKIPGVKQLMDRDIREAKEHLDMTGDFPFGGHGDPVSDLKSIKKSIEEDTMPIFMYRLTHPDSKLTEAERKIVYKWIDEAVERFEETQQ